MTDQVVTVANNAQHANTLLNLMGIDVWTLKTNVLATVAVASDQTVASQPLSRQTNQAQAAPSLAATALSSGAQAGMASLDVLRQQLNEPNTSKRMAKAEVVAAEVVPDTDAQTTSDVSQTITEEDASDEFLLLYLDYADHTTILSLPYGSASLPNEYRLFADDIATALMLVGRDVDAPVSISSPQVQVRDLSWPMIQSSQIKPTMDDAKALILQKTKPSKDFLIICGEIPAKYLSAIRPMIKEKQLIYVADIPTHFKSASHKRALWEQLEPFRAYLRTRAKSKQG